jgi:Protein of unknown function (DUF2673)
MTMKIDFEFQTEHGLFRDALHLPDDHGLTDEQIEAMKAERRDNWIAVVTATAAEEPEQDYVEIDGVRYAKVVE